MTATLSMIPLAKIRPSDGDNPRSQFDDDQMAELTDRTQRQLDSTNTWLALQR